MALLAVYAAAEGKFWGVHDLLYQWAGNRQEIDLHELASMTDLQADRLADAAENPGIREKLTADIRFGMQLAVQATPSYLIEGKIYQGTIPPEVFEGIVE